MIMAWAKGSCRLVDEKGVTWLPGKAFILEDIARDWSTTGDAVRKFIKRKGEGKIIVVGGRISEDHLKALKILYLGHE